MIWGLLLLLPAACATPSARGVPDELRQLPWSDAPADQNVLRARALVDRGEDREALALVESVLAVEPRHVDGNRVRQDILRRRGRRGLLLAELESWLRADPDDALAHYLRGRVTFDQREKLRWFERAAELGPHLMWPWLGTAHTLVRFDAERAMRIYTRLYEVTDAHPIVAIAYGQALRRVGQTERAVTVYRTLADDRRVPGVGDLGLAQALLALDDREAAWGALVSALRQRPFDPGVRSLVLGWIRAGASDDQVSELYDVLRESPDAMAAFGRGDGASALVELFERHRQPRAALALLERIGTTARDVDLRRTQRRLMLGIGDVAGFLAIVRADTPRAIVAHEGNQLRGRWLTLLDGPWSDGEPLASAAQAAALLDALMTTGFVSEAEQVGGLARERWPADAAIAAGLAEARAELAFEAGLRRVLYRGYRGGDRAPLATVAARLRELSLRVLGRDVVGEPRRFRVPLVGEMFDPFRGELANHLERYNRHLVLGRRAGGTAEGMLLTRLSVAELPDQAELPLPGRCFEVVAVDRDVQAFSGVVGGDVAGIALLNHYLIDFDAVREWAASIAERRRIAAADGNLLVRDPLPADPGFDPVDVAHRLALLSSVQDADLDLAVLDTIRHHERQHLVDSFHYLPIEYNLGRGLGLLWRFGLSAARIEAEMERRAELASLALSPHTALVLAHIVDFLGDPGTESPHHRGFGELARELARRFTELGIEPAGAVPSRWHLLDMALVQRAARDLLARIP